MTREEPFWRLRLATAEAAAAITDAVDYHHAVESGMAVEPDIVFHSRRRRIRARRRLALDRWIREGYAQLRSA